MNAVPFTHAGRPGLIEIHQGNAFVRWAGIGFEAGAATGPLREVIRATLEGKVSVADRATPHHTLDVTDLSVDEAEARGAYWLEDRAGFSRYWIGAEESAWACRDCGTFGGSPDDGDGCPMCGFGAEDDEDDMED
ncbi:MAG: hypothetical protein MZV65_31825 [Chromatiales bacterium]|nr:hypothetical protein [Chromatiales bacterium]